MTTKKQDLFRYKGLVAAIRIDHASYENIRKQIGDAYDNVGTSATPICLHLVGETRTGKSTVVDDFLSSHAPLWEMEGMRQTVVYAAAPPKATVKGLLERLLMGLGDPHWSRGSERNMTARLLTLLNGVGCRMIVLDELQHLCDKGQKKRLFDSSDFLKELVENKKWGLVAVGLPESASVINANRQLAGRFDATLHMPLFDWRDAGSRRQFKGILKAFREQLHPFEMPQLEENDMALRMYLATTGRVGLVAKLMDRAVNDAIRKDTTKIRIDDLGRAFATAIWFAPRFPLPGGPFGAEIEECLRENVSGKVITLANEDDYEDNSGAVKVRTPTKQSVRSGAPTVPKGSVGHGRPPKATKKSVAAELAGVI